jgi:hypothetical protein
MAFNNPQTGKSIILTGDREQAGRFLPLARRKSRELRTVMNMTNSNMIQKAYFYLKGCLEISIRIVDNSEFIRIHACSGEVDCKASVRIISNVGDTIQIGVTPKDIPDTFKPLIMVFWGDTYSTRNINTDNDQEQTFTYQYKTTDTYNITVVVAERVAPGAIVPTWTYTSYKREEPSTHTSFPAAHAACLALPWSVVSNNVATVESRPTGSGIGADHGWKMGRVILTWDTSEVPVKAIFDVQTSHGPSNNNDPLSFPVMWIDGVNNGAFADRRNPPFPIRQQQAFDPIPENLTQIEFGDNNEWAYGTGQGFFTPGTNIQWGIFPIGCKVTKTLEAEMVF